MNNQEFDKAIKDMTPREIVSFSLKLGAGAVLGFVMGRFLIWLSVVLFVIGFLWVISLFA